MTEAQRVDAERANCPRCHGHGMIPCPAHGARLDPQWGTCWECDEDPADPAGEVRCPCQL